MKKILLVANTSWYLYNYRISFAKFLAENGFEPVFVAPEDEYSDKIKEEGFRYIPIDIERKGVNPLREWRVIQNFFRIYSQEKPDLVHHHTAKTVIYGTLASKKLKIPTVNSITGLGYAFTDKSFKAKLLKPLILSMFQFALRGQQSGEVIFQNLYNLKYFTNKNIVSKVRSHYVPGSGAEKEKYYPEKKDTPIENTPVVMFPTRMLWDKGVGVFAEAARILKEKKTVCRMVLVGTTDPGNPNSIPQTVIDDWVSEGVLENWGWQSNMRTVYNQCDILVYPSFSEGLPRTLIEASLCEKAIIASDIPGCNDVITDQKNGLLVPAHDASSLAQAIEKLLTNQKLSAKLARNAREKALSQYEQSVISQKTIGVYQLIV